MGPVNLQPQKGMKWDLVFGVFFGGGFCDSMGFLLLFYCGGFCLVDFGFLLGFGGLSSFLGFFDQGRGVGTVLFTCMNPHH